MDASVSTDCPRAVTTTEDSPSVDRHAGAVEGIEASVGALRRQFEDLPVAEILVSCQALLTVIEHQLDGDDMGAEESRLLVVASGWVWASLACAHFDAGQFWRAESCWQAVRETAAQVGHAELAAWAWEMCSRFALADRRFQLALAAAEAGQAFAHRGPVAAWLALSAAKAAARLDDRTAATDALDRARQVIEQMPRPHDSENCFGIDEARLASHTATVLLWLGQTEPAEDHAWQALTRLVDPDGHTRYPIRAAEARLTLGLVAACRGDLGQAVHHGRMALSGQRVCAPVLLAGAGDLHAALCAAGPPGGAPMIREFAAAISDLASRYGLDS